ncbi:hypothetical protein V5799_004191 [Amblyomma americanum]|uniref:Uncharacterized protein n=1 Tax=Amblyomma americanum TaxID=6943 RepID=A0AAQ4D6T7_AMBAM
MPYFSAEQDHCWGNILRRTEPRPPRSRARDGARSGRPIQRAPHWRGVIGEVPWRAAERCSPPTHADGLAAWHMLGEAHTSEGARVQSAVSFALIYVDSQRKPQGNQVQPPPSTVETAAVAYVAGFVVKAIEEQRICSACPRLNDSGPSIAPVMGLINHQNRGGLVFPKAEFVAVLVKVKKAIDIAVPHIGRNDVCKTITAMILPHLESCPVFICDAREDHASITSSIVAKKFIKPLLSNAAAVVTDRVAYRKKLITKPLSRTVLRV